MEKLVRKNYERKHIKKNIAEGKEIKLKIKCRK